MDPSAITATSRDEDENENEIGVIELSLGVRLAEPRSLRIELWGVNEERRGWARSGKPLLRSIKDLCETISVEGADSLAATALLSARHYRVLATLSISRPSCASSFSITHFQRNAGALIDRKHPGIRESSN